MKVPNGALEEYRRKGSAENILLGKCENMTKRGPKESEVVLRYLKEIKMSY